MKGACVTPNKKERKTSVTHGDYKVQSYTPNFGEKPQVIKAAECSNFFDVARVVMITSSNAPV